MTADTASIASGRIRRMVTALRSETGMQRFVSTLLMLVLGFLAVLFASQRARLDTGIAKIDISTEAKRFASELIFSKMTALAQTTIGLIGATWAILIVSETRVRLINIWSSVLFVVTNAFYLGSLLTYDAGYDFIVSRIFDHGAFDIHSRVVSFWLGWQRGLFLWGCLSLALMILLWRRKS